MKEFFGIGGYERPAAGFLSFDHIAFVTFFVALMLFFAIYLGIKHRGADERKKNRVLQILGIALIAIEIFETIFFTIRNEDPLYIRMNLPFFFCSLQTIAIPLASVSKGRLREAALDFIVVFGMLGALLGTYFAGNNYGTYPAVCIDNVISSLTHVMAGFASLYIIISGMYSMKKENMPINMAILGVFSVMAYIAGVICDYNYMFFFSHDGTPYSIFYNLVNGNKVLYPLIVVGLFYLFILIYYPIFNYFKAKIQNRKAK